MQTADIYYAYIYCMRLWGCIIVKVTVYKVDPDKSLTDVLVADGSEPNDKIAPSYFPHFYIICEPFLWATLKRIILFFSGGCYNPSY